MKEYLKPRYVSICSYEIPILTQALCSNFKGALHSFCGTPEKDQDEVCVDCVVEQGPHKEPASRAIVSKAGSYLALDWPVNVLMEKSGKTTRDGFLGYLNTSGMCSNAQNARSPEEEHCKGMNMGKERKIQEESPSLK